jgi:hypothetical protein
MAVTAPSCDLDNQEVRSTSSPPDGHRTPARALTTNILSEVLPAVEHQVREEPGQPETEEDQSG